MSIKILKSTVQKKKKKHREVLKFFDDMIANMISNKTFD